jgi:23S rRNA (guanine745-N1)-methyltransferase
MASALKDDGLLILVWPTSRHLIELKQVMYKQLKTSQYDPCVELAPLFSMASKQTLAFEFTITLAAQLFTLLDMTPHGQRINTETKASLLQNLPMQLSFSVNIGCFIKRASI